MAEIKTELLFKIVLEVPSILDLGETPYGRRRIARVGGGTFEGPKMKGRVLDGGGDWLLLRRDGVLQLDVRLTLETDDKQHVYMTYRGYRHGPKDVIDRLNRGEAVDASLYYFRATPYFETMPATTTTNAPVGPAICTREPPSADTMKPVTTAQ